MKISPKGSRSTQSAFPMWRAEDPRYRQGGERRTRNTAGRSNFQIFSPQNFSQGREINSSSSFWLLPLFPSGREPTQLSSPDGGKVQQPKERRGGGLIREPSQSHLGLPFSISSARKPHSTHTCLSLLNFSLCIFSSLIPTRFCVSKGSLQRDGARETPLHSTRKPPLSGRKIIIIRGAHLAPLVMTQSDPRDTSHGSAVTDAFGDTSNRCAHKDSLRHRCSSEHWS